MSDESGRTSPRNWHAVEASAQTESDSKRKYPELEFHGFLPDDEHEPRQRYCGRIAYAVSFFTK